MTLPELNEKRRELRERLKHVFSPTRREELEGRIEAVDEAIRQKGAEMEQLQGRMFGEVE